ncbi:hypothetical protein LNTAR_07254 [Lentisphaera araneosa HTCC2155]|jgi:hypothetical protein|uniref:HEAT repeat domain-containing protein n=2 Tax=Lentisphaera araneosa HTCC2155 TaxID=313628 RepID=A6DMY6_9BACT|nr:HEAT repeat domain-containing protein [Lentisphaera araneosa]EDM27022.1 hypothetical protein LNTAR_07254 [Lentisphaera araneosa HTCC2155]
MKAKLLIGLTTLSIVTGCTSSLEKRISKLEQATIKEHDDPKIEKLLSQLTAASYYSSYKPTKNDILTALGLLKEKSSVPQIIALAKVSDNRHFRSQAYKVLGWIQDERSIDYLKHSMKNDSYIHARRSAAYALEQITGEKYLTEENGFEDESTILKKYLEMRKKDQSEK